MSRGTVFQLQACQDQVLVYRTQKGIPLFEHYKTEQS